MSITDQVTPVKPTKETMTILLVFIGICIGIGIAIGYFLPH